MHRARKLAKRAIGSFTELVADLPLVVLAWGPDFSVVTVVWSPWLSERACGAETGTAGRTGKIGVGRSQSPTGKPISIGRKQHRWNSCFSLAKA